MSQKVKGTEMTDVYYKADFNGMLLGQKIKNTLYYKTESEVYSELFDMAGAEGLANNLEQEVWSLGWKQAVSTEYTLLDITVTPYNDVFELLYSMPFVLPVNDNGMDSANCMPPSVCVNIRFNFGAVNALQSAVVPKKGYIAVAGVTEASQDDGVLTNSFWNNADASFGKLARKLSEPIQELTPPAIWIPVRMKPSGTLGVGLQKFLGAIEVQNSFVDPILSNRRSRKLGS